MHKDGVFLDTSGSGSKTGSQGDKASSLCTGFSSLSGSSARSSGFDTKVVPSFVPRRTTLDEEEDLFLQL